MECKSYTNRDAPPSGSESPFTMALIVGNPTVLGWYLSWNLMTIVGVKNPLVVKLTFLFFRGVKSTKQDYNG